MKTKNKSTYITSVDDLFKYYLKGSEDELYISNIFSPEIVVEFTKLLDKEIKIIYYDHREFLGPNYTDLKRNGRVAFKLNKSITIYKQTYYYYSKGRKKFYTTMIPEHIDKYCNYTRKIKNHRIIQTKIFYASYENTAEVINEENNINISRQTVYLHERGVLKSFLYNKEIEIFKKIKKLEINASGYYHYDEEFLKINKEKYARLSLIDAHTCIIIKDILIPQKYFNKDHIKDFMFTSLDGLPLECIITDGHTAYPSIIDELGCKHQLYKFHIMQTLMKPLNQIIRRKENRLASFESQIEEKTKQIDKLESEYPYKKGRTPKSDLKAINNVKDRRELKTERSRLIDKTYEYNQQIRDLKTYVERIKVILRVKTLKTAINKINKLLNQEKELPEVISKFLKNLLKKIDRAVQFTTDPSIPATNNLIELFYKVTFPGKIKRIYRTYEGAMNRIRLNNIRWMERNVIAKFEKNMQDQ